MQQELKRLCQMYAQYLPRVVVCEQIPCFVQDFLISKKVILLEQVYNKPKTTKRQKREAKDNSSRLPKPFSLVFKSGFFPQLCDPESTLHLHQTDTVCSFFYLEKVCQNKDHLLHLLTFLTCILKRGGYFMGTFFDAFQVLQTFTKDVEGKEIQVPKETFDKCQLHLLDGKNNHTLLSSLKIPFQSSFSLMQVSEKQREQLNLPSPCIFTDWNSLEKQILRFGFRLVETRLFSPVEIINVPICRSFVFQLVANCLFEES